MARTRRIVVFLHPQPNFAEERKIIRNTQVNASLSNLVYLCSVKDAHADKIGKVNFSLVFPHIMIGEGGKLSDP